jgi:pyruvate dehydrogenase E1 component
VASSPPGKSRSNPLKTDSLAELFAEFQQGSEGRKASTTMAFVRMLAKMLRDKEIGELVVPIVPDEARTFGMEALFRQVGIYAHAGQLYEPVDMDTLLYYKEAKKGRFSRKGLPRPDRFRQFIAAGSAVRHARHQYHSRSSSTTRCSGCSASATWCGPRPIRARGASCSAVPPDAPRSSGEGLQHQDGHSHLLSLAVPNLISYDPAFAFEIAVIIEDGIRRMYKDGESIFYYITVMNEQYEMLRMPEGAREGILKGLYLLRATQQKKAKVRAQLLGSGAILNEALKAQQILEEKYNVATDVWSVTSYQELYREGHAVERWNRMHPGEKPRVSYVTQCLAGTEGVIVAASDYVKVLPDAIDRWTGRRITSLGTDGFGRSEGRASLRDFFEVDAKHIVLATLVDLARDGKVEAGVPQKAVKDLGINPDKPNPAIS